MAKNIYMVGFMGVGKTTVGKIVAGKLNRKFVEMDEIIAKNEKMAIVDIFTQKGEPYFRMKENDLLGDLSKKADLVVSCGGGLICNEDNAKVMKDTGVVFNLRATPQTIYARTKQFKNRPLLNVDNPMEEIRKLLNQRAPHYAKTDYAIDTDDLSPQEVASVIIDFVKKRTKFEGGS